MSYTSIGIASYKGAKRVNWCIESIKKFSTNDGENYKIVVYDDGTPDSGQSFKQVCDKHNVPLIRSEENRGISYGWNKVSHYYDDAEILVVLNDDIIVQPDWLKCMNFFLRNNPEYAASGWPLSWCNYEEMEKLVNNEKITPRDPITKQLRPEWEGRNDGKNRCGRVMCMIGSCFAYLRENFLKVGNFDEGFKSFHEESDWGTRAAQMGMPSSGLSYQLQRRGGEATRDELQLSGTWAMVAASAEQVDLVLRGMGGVSLTMDVSPTQVFI